MFFYMGSRALPVEAATHYSLLVHAPLVSRISSWLLENQFVDFGALGEIMKVETGTGMGSRSSGCLANAGFRYAFERLLMSLFEESVC